MSPSPYRRALVTRLADQEFRGVDQGLQAPAQQLAACVLAGAAHTAGLARQGPVADRVGGQALDTCHQQRDVVLAVVGVEGVEDVVADVLQGAEGSVSAPTNAWRPSSRG